jgi:prephenate dehydrogenase
MLVKSVGIIGFGDFGKFLYSLAKERLPHLEVKVFSSRMPPDDKTFFSFDEVCKTDVLFPCVPISAFAATVDRTLPHLGENAVVCDVATVKKYTASILRDKGVRNYIATHPMFGPYSYEKHGHSLKDLRIVVCESSLPEATVKQISGFLRQAGLKVLEMTTDEHDRLVAETLFLTHLVGQTIKKGEFERTSVDTVSFGFLMDAVESVAHDEALFRDVYRYNPYCKDVLSRFGRAEEEVISSLHRNGSMSGDTETSRY